MTYSPAQAGVMTGEDFFTSLGLIGGSTGLAPLISANKTIPAVDAYSSQLAAPAITDSVLKYTQNSNGNLAVSWNFALMDKVLGLCYFHQGTNADIQGLWFSENTYTGTPSGTYYEDGYNFRNHVFGSADRVELQSRVGATAATVGSDLTICVDDDPFSHAYGLALNCKKGNPGVQKCYVKYGSTSQWFRWFSATDGNFTTGFQSFGILTGYYAGNVGRMISPFYVWGVA